MTKSSLHFHVERPLPKGLVNDLIAVRLAESPRSGYAGRGGVLPERRLVVRAAGAGDPRHVLLGPGSDRSDRLLK